MNSLTVNDGMKILNLLSMFGYCIYNTCMFMYILNGVSCQTAYIIGLLIFFLKLFYINSDAYPEQLFTTKSSNWNTQIKNGNISSFFPAQRLKLYQSYRSIFLFSSVSTSKNFFSKHFQYSSQKTG